MRICPTTSKQAVSFTLEMFKMINLSKETIFIYLYIIFFEQSKEFWPADWSVLPINFPVIWS